MVTLFCSYSHKDEGLRDKLETHLALLKRQGVISAWHDRRITAGRDLHQSISAELESAQIILLLVSANFLDSDYCYEKEMTRALEKSNSGAAIVIPVILHPCDWHSAPFGRLKATPTDGKAVSSYPNEHEAFSIIAKDVRAAATSAVGTKSASDSAHQKHSESRLPEPRSSNLRVKRRFTDQERDEFLEDSFEYIARYFDASLKELRARDNHLQTKFNRLSKTSFTASVYADGKRVAQCSIWYGGNSFLSQGIAYSNSGDAPGNSFNESLGMMDDGYTLQLKPLGMQMFGRQKEDALSQQSAAEFYWDLMIQPIQK